MSCCETMVKIVCKSSKLKSDSYMYKKDNMYCEMCNNMAYEDAEHLMIHCQHFDRIRIDMFSKLNDVELMYNVQVIRPHDNNFHLMLGKFPPDIDQKIMFTMLRIIAMSVDSMYKILVKNREGVG